MTTNRDDLEPLAPADAYELFIDHKETTCVSATVRNYRYRLQYFVQWCEQQGIDNLNDLSGRDIQQFRLWRKNSKDLAPMTLRNHLSSLRVFLKWCGSIEAVPENLYDKILIPKVAHGERQSDAMLEAETAKEILEYLSTYHFASIEHVGLALLWETGIRIGAAESIDLDDVRFADEAIEIRHRPDQGTTLKNGKSGERPIAITTELTTLLDEYVTTHRHDVTDDYDLDPLLTTRNGRMNKNTLRRIIYKVTAPCFRDDPCPDCESTSGRPCPDTGHHGSTEL